MRASGGGAVLAGITGLLSAIILVLVFGAFFLPACGLRLPFFGVVSACPAETVVDQNRAIRSLRAEIRTLEERLSARQCAENESEDSAASTGAGNNQQHAEAPRLDENAAPDGSGRPEAPNLDEQELGEGAPGDQYAESEPQCNIDPQQANIVVVLDGSSSMLRPIDTDPELEKQLFAQAQTDREASNRLESLKFLPGKKRIDVAKEAIVAVLEKLPTERRKVVTFRSCDEIENHTGSEAIPGVLGLQPKTSTPIARSMLSAASILDASMPGKIVMVSDGSDTCGGDICQAANQIRETHPNIVIDVIDLSGWTEISCLSNRTGGRYLPFAQGIDVGQVVEQKTLRRDCD